MSNLKECPCGQPVLKISRTSSTETLVHQIIACPSGPKIFGCTLSTLERKSLPEPVDQPEPISTQPLSAEPIEPIVPVEPDAPVAPALSLDDLGDDPGWEILS